MTDISIPQTPLKQCVECEKFFPPTAEYFRRSADRKCGLRERCKPCDRKRDQARCAEKREARNEKARVYYHANKQRIRTQARERYKRDPSRTLESNKCWHKEHPEELKAIKQRWVDNHHEQTLVRAAIYRAKNKEVVQERSKRWHKAHPEASRAIVQRRRARKMQAEGTYNANDVAVMMRSQKGLCWWCGEKLSEKYDVDHRVPLSRGGSNAPENLCLSCISCNRSKNDKLPQEWNGRLL